MWDLSAIQIAEVLTLLFAGGILQGSIGFAGGVFSIPLMLLVGLELHEAVGVNLISAVVQNGVGVYSLRRQIVWRDAAFPLGLRLLSLPLGVWALWNASALPPDSVKAIVGVLLLTIIAIQWLFRVQPRDDIPIVWTTLAFLSSGFLAGFCGMGGALMALWVIAHPWNSQRSRGFLFVAFFVTLVPLLVIMLVAFQHTILPAYLIGLFGLPVSLGGAWIGFAIGDRLPRVMLRRLIYAVLLFVAIRAAVSPIFEHLASI